MPSPDEVARDLLISGSPASRGDRGNLGPARTADLSGLLPAYIATAEFDPNRDEAITYGLRLLQAGVSVELHHGRASNGRAES